jgi:hypothetical protein
MAQSRVQSPMHSGGPLEIGQGAGSGPMGRHRPRFRSTSGFRALDEAEMGRSDGKVAGSGAEWGDVGYSGAVFRYRGGGAPPTPPPRSGQLP